MGLSRSGCDAHLLILTHLATTGRVHRSAPPVPRAGSLWGKHPPIDESNKGGRRVSNPWPDVCTRHAASRRGKGGGAHARRASPRKKVAPVGATDGTERVERRNAFANTMPMHPSSSRTPLFCERHGGCAPLLMMWVFLLFPSKAKPHHLTSLPGPPEVLCHCQNPRRREWDWPMLA